MIITGERTIDATLERTRSALSAPRAVSDASGAVSDFEELGGNAVRVRFAPRLNLGTRDLVMEVRAEWTSDRELHLVGFGSGTEHAVHLEGDVDVCELGESTTIRWQLDLAFMGVLAAVGQRALPSIARDQVEKALDAVATVASGA